MRTVWCAARRGVISAGVVLIMALGLLASPRGAPASAGAQTTATRAESSTLSGVQVSGAEVISSNSQASRIARTSASVRPSSVLAGTGDVLVRLVFKNRRVRETRRVQWTIPVGWTSPQRVAGRPGFVQLSGSCRGVGSGFMLTRLSNGATRIGARIRCSRHQRAFLYYEAVEPSTRAAVYAFTVRYRLAGSARMRGVRSQPSVIVRPDFATTLVILTQPGDGVAGVPLPSAPVVAVVDQYSNRVPITVPVTIEPASGWAPSGTVTTNAVNGVARFPDIRYYAADTGVKIRFTSVFADGGGLRSAPSTAFTITPAAPAKLAFTIPPHDTPVGQNLAPAPRVQVRDTYGNDVPVAGIPVTVSLQDAAAGTDLTGTLTVTTGADGAAVFSELQVDEVDPFLHLLATTSGLSQASGAPFATTQN